jgi:hypothetical protein
MRIKEIYKDLENEYKLEFRETASIGARFFSPVTEDPICIKIIPSGWDYGYPTYHVIIEYGDMDNSDYHFLSSDQIKEKYGIDLSLENEEESSEITPSETAQIDLMGDLIKDSYEKGLESEVVFFALKAMKNDPSLDPHQALSIGYMEWIK